MTKQDKPPSDEDTGFGFSTGNGSFRFSFFFHIGGDVDEKLREEFKSYRGGPRGGRFGPGYEEPPRTKQPEGCPHRFMGVPCDVSEADLRSRYWELANKCHPDKGGEDTPFEDTPWKKLNKAYQAALTVFSDE